MPASPYHPLRLGQAQSLLTQGRRDEAANVYRQVLAEDPQNAEALYLLGMLTLQGGQLEPGLELLRQSLAIAPDAPQAQESFGLGLEQLGRRPEALTAFDRLVQLAPDHVNGYAHRSRVLEAMGRRDDALIDIDKALSLRRDPVLLLNRGAILLNLQRPADALTAFDQAIAASQGQAHPLVYFNRGVAFTALNRLEEAVTSYDEAVLRHPGYGDAFINRGRALEDLGRVDEALASFDSALALVPDSVIARANRVALLARMGRRTEALAVLDAAIAAEPANAMAWNNRGAVLDSIGELAPALGDFDRAIALQPDFVKAHSNRAIVLQAMGALDASLAALDRVIALDPAASAPLDKALLLLLQGRFAEGLALHETRPRRVPPGLDPAKLWHGLSQDVAGKTVLISAEGGLGDILMMSRYLIELAARGAAIVLAVPPVMVRLLRTLPVPFIFAENAAPDTADFHAVMLSLPWLFATRVETIPAPVPYLKAESERVGEWRARLGDHGFRIAIAWQGKSRGANDARRSFPLAALAPLAAMPGVRLISLQRGEGNEQLDALPPGMTVERLGEDFDAGSDAFLDSAAVIAACDLVITPDTSIAHLAGAMGRPVWTALKSVPEWRWLLQRSDTPWYPTMTLYRQPRFGDWTSVFAAMARDLAAQMVRKRTVPIN